MSRGIGFVVVTIAMSVFFLAAAPRASAAPPADACALISAAQVSADVGVTVGAGTHVTPTYLKTCTWTGSVAGGSRTVTVSYQEASAFAGAKQMMQQMAAMQTKKAGQSGLVNSSAGGIGDDAFYSSMNGRYTALLVKKGDVSFKVAIYGEVAMDQAQAMEKAIALQVLSKL